MRKLICLFITFILINVSISGCNPQKAEDAISKEHNNKEVESIEAEDYKARVAKKMNDLFDFIGKDNYFSGFILAGTQDELIYAGGCGYADYEKKLEINQDTKFKVGSIVKQITATAIMQLQEKGLLDVSDKLEKYVPDFPFANQITIHHLLTHSSGLETNTEYDMRHYISGEERDLATGDKRSKDVGLMFEPGQGFNYSNVGYILLGFIVEKVSGEGLDVYFKENIFDPLEMKNTGFITADANLDNFAVGYLNGEQTLSSPDKYLFDAKQEGAAGFYSTAADLYKWNVALHSGKILKPKTQDIMFTRHNDDYGYGWYIFGDSPGPVSYVHDGHSEGYRSKLIKTSEGVSIVILSNYEEAYLDYILDQVIPILVDEENDEPTS